NRARRTIDGDRCTGDRSNIAADFEWITDVLAPELCCELRQIDRKVSVWFVVLGNENPSKVGIEIEAHQNLNRPIVSAFQWLEFCRPERVARDRLRARVTRIRHIVRNRTGLLGRK